MNILRRLSSAFKIVAASDTATEPQTISQIIVGKVAFSQDNPDELTFTSGTGEEMRLKTSDSDDVQERFKIAANFVQTHNGPVFLMKENGRSSLFVKRRNLNVQEIS